MGASFDHIAQEYDEDFTSSPIGLAQRNLVFEGLKSCVSDLKSLNILEVNCGTGQDALTFGELGATVLATDISPEMVKVTAQKSAHLPNVNSAVLDITMLDTFEPNKTFDLIFSNFGGLNCLTEVELQTFFTDAENKLARNGKLVLVIMPDFCLWESLYFTAKFEFSKAFRRKSKSGVMANVDGQEVKTYYYSPSGIKQLATGFVATQIQSIGFFVPPSYLNPFFNKRPKTLQKLHDLDKNRLNSAKLASLSDHFLICLQKK